MSSNRFAVYVDDVMAASYMSLEVAMILVKGLFMEYYKEREISITICKMDMDTKEVNDA